MDPFSCTATQYDGTEVEAKNFTRNGCQSVTERGNMPSPTEAVHIILKSYTCLAPAKAANADDVTVSGFEDTKLLETMEDISVNVASTEKILVLKKTMSMVPTSPDLKAPPTRCSSRAIWKYLYLNNKYRK